MAGEIILFSYFAILSEIQEAIEEYDKLTKSIDPGCISKKDSRNKMSQQQKLRIKHSNKFR